MGGGTFLFLGDGVPGGGVLSTDELSIICIAMPSSAASASGCDRSRSGGFSLSRGVGTGDPVGDTEGG